MSQTPQGQVDVLLFRVGQTRYGADASQVVRIDRATVSTKLAHALDAPQTGTRVLVFVTAEGETSFYVDEVEGVRRVDSSDLRRVPPAAGQTTGVVGLWLETPEKAIVLVDLPTILEAAPGGQ